MEYLHITGDEILLREACVKAEALYLTYASHRRLYGKAIKLLHAPGKLLHVRVAGAAPAQHKGYERVH